MLRKYIPHIFPLIGKNSSIKKCALLEMLAQGVPYCLQQDSIAVRADIAYRHNAVRRYRGYTLCSDRTGKIALIDPHSWNYLGMSGDILFIQGYEQTTLLIDKIIRE